MTTRSNIPEAVAKTLQTPYWGVLTLATYVLGASNNWLLLRYLKACFDEKNAVRLQDADGDATTTRRDVPPADILVVFVSWMRDFDFWRAEARKAMVRQKADLTELATMLISNKGPRSSQAAAAGPLYFHRWND